MADIAGKAVFDTGIPVTASGGGSIACSNGICGGFLPDFGSLSSLTLPGSAHLTTGVSYRVRSEIAVTAPPGQFFVGSRFGGSAPAPWFTCTPDDPGNVGFICWFGTGPLSLP